MTEQEFGELFLRYNENIRKVLKSKKILDEDLINDTYIALYEDSQHNEIGDFVNAYVVSNVQLAALEIIDESQEVEILDRHIDYDLEQFTAECTIRDDDKERLQQLLEDYYKHPQPDERNHKRACKILKLYLQGKSEREIANKLKIAQPTVHQHIGRAIKRMKAITLCKYYRGA